MDCGTPVPTKVRVDPLAFCDRVHYETGIVKFAESRYAAIRPECIIVRGKTEIPLKFELNDIFGEEMNEKKIQVKGDLKNDQHGDLFLYVSAWREL